jgi:hypothetical protein
VAGAFLSQIRRILQLLPQRGNGQPKAGLARVTSMFNFVSFGLSDMLQCSSGLRQAAAGATTMEEAARSVVGYLDGNYRHGSARES